MWSLFNETEARIWRTRRTFEFKKGKTNMRFASLILRSFALMILAGQVAFAQEGLTAKSLEGVWKVTKVVQAGVANNDPQPGLLIFSRGYTAPPGSPPADPASKRLIPRTPKT